MKRLKLRLCRWLLGDDLNAILNLVLMTRQELQQHKKEHDETNYDRWQENRINRIHINRLALKLKLNEIVEACPEDN